jgi:hypothetical protein
MPAAPHLKRSPRSCSVLVMIAGYNRPLGNGPKPHPPGLVLFGPKTKHACEVGKKARPVRGRFVRRAFQGKPRSSALLPTRRTEKPRVLEFFQIR